MITDRDFADWLEHPVTGEFRKALAAKRAALKNEWEQSDPAAYTKDAFILASVGNIGWCRGLAFAETMDYEQLIGELDDGEYKRVVPQGQGSTDSNVRAGTEGREDHDS